MMANEQAVRDRPNFGLVNPTVRQHRAAIGPRKPPVTSPQSAGRPPPTRVPHPRADGPIPIDVGPEAGEPLLTGDDRRRAFAASHARYPLSVVRGDDLRANEIGPPGRGLAVEFVDERRHYILPPRSSSNVSVLTSGGGSGSAG